jgi:long-chain fatty acid adenylyltransferase FadD28
MNGGTTSERDRNVTPMNARFLPAVLRTCARLQPDNTAFTFIDYERDWAGIAESLTWSQVYRRALNVAQELRVHGSVGDRAVIAAPQGLDYVTAFLGALQAGLIAVPLSVPLGGASDERVSSVLRDASPNVVLTTSSVAGNLGEYVKSGESAPSVIEVDLLDLDSKKGPAAEENSSANIAYLQYTSGSTRTPAGVMISYKNLLANFEQTMSDYYQDHGEVPPPDATLVSWLPFYHDMGLYHGIIFPILTGMRAVLTSPVSFLQRPARWMHLLASNSHTCSAAPNFAFDFTARKTSDADMAGLDLGDVLYLMDGSERV